MQNHIACSVQLDIKRCRNFYHSTIDIAQNKVTQMESLRYARRMKSRSLYDNNVINCKRFMFGVWDIWRKLVFEKFGADLNKLIPVYYYSKHICMAFSDVPN